MISRLAMVDFVTAAVIGAVIGIAIILLDVLIPIVA